MNKRTFLKTLLAIPLSYSLLHFLRRKRGLAPLAQVIGSNNLIHIPDNQLGSLNPGDELLLSFKDGESEIIRFISWQSLDSRTAIVRRQVLEAIPKNIRKVTKDNVHSIVMISKFWIL